MFEEDENVMTKIEGVNIYQNVFFVFNGIDWYATELMMSLLFIYIAWFQME